MNTFVYIQQMKKIIMAEDSTSKSNRKTALSTVNDYLCLPFSFWLAGLYDRRQRFHAVAVKIHWINLYQFGPYDRVSVYTVIFSIC